MSALENETLHETTTIKDFDREWTVPTKRHLSHLVKMRDAVKLGVGGLDLMIAETFLDAAQFADLLELDPDEDQLDKFTQLISDALGLGSTGNSSPSSASS